MSSLQGSVVALPGMSNSCGCIGPQRGEPFCPCQMAAYGVTVINGRYVQPARDLGPASTVRGPLLDDAKVREATDWLRSVVTPPPDQPYRG